MVRRKKKHFYEKYFGFSEMDIFKNVQNQVFLKSLEIKHFFLTENIFCILFIWLHSIIDNKDKNK